MMMATTAQVVSGWGRVAPTEVAMARPSSVDELAAKDLPPGAVLARGLGRSYGDAATPSGSGVSTTACTNSRWVDQANGVLQVDAGVTIGSLIDRFGPKGWFVPVSPGTRNVTIGGAIAADIHGKNHHVHGSFGAHVRSIRLRLADDSILNLSPTNEPAIFWATIGGMGLTGIIVDATIALMAIPSTTVRVETSRLDNLDELLSEMRRSDSRHSFSVAWVDLLGGGRSVLTQGDFATPDQLNSAAGPLTQPRSPSIQLPGIPLPRLVHRHSIRVFNELWFRMAPSSMTTSDESVTRFWHPLDAISDWNRLYGPAGFYQWQCVVPDGAESELHSICEELAYHPAFFTVLKRFGPANPAPLSFPMPGWTLAVDLPATSSVRGLLDRLDDRVVASGGRIYLAKDARMSRETFEASYPRLAQWKQVRSAVDPHRRFRSALSDRLNL